MLFPVKHIVNGGQLLFYVKSSDYSITCNTAERLKYEIFFKCYILLNNFEFCFRDVRMLVCCLEHFDLLIARFVYNMYWRFLFLADDIYFAISKCS